jgi:hypothetical protein
MTPYQHDGGKEKGVERGVRALAALKFFNLVFSVSLCLCGEFVV